MSMRRLEVWAFDEPTWGDVNLTFGRNPGIYRVKLKNTSLDGYQPVPRLLGTDPSGLLYVGMSDAIIGRFGGLRAGIWGAYRFTDAEGRTYTRPEIHRVGSKMLGGFAARVEKERVFIEVEGYPLPTSAPEAYDAGKHEAEVIAEFCGRFGEPPPFNDTWGTALPSSAADE